MGTLCTGTASWPNCSTSTCWATLPTLDSDLSQGVPAVQGLALCTLSTMGSAEMCRDLAGEVEKLLQLPSPYVRKKAILTAVHMIRKVPDLSTIFLPPCAKLLHERHHGILLGTVTLITELCERSPAALKHFRKVVPHLVQILRTLSTTGFSSEHSIAGVSDPFLQVQILRLLRILGRNHEESSEAMNDLLAQVATNTDTSRNAGNAVLFETVLTIMDIHSAAGLRVLAVNILGRFLLNNDKNIRYVALTSLLRLVQTDHSAVQRHRPTVVECLREPDASLGRRALELSLALVNSSNVRAMTQELQHFLETCPPELRADCASGILLAAERFAPTKRWHIDTILRVLTTAGAYVRDDAVANLTQLIGGAQELHAYSVRRLYSALAEDISQQPLVQVAAWCIGEYGDLLLAGSCEETEPLQVRPPRGRGHAVAGGNRLAPRLRPVPTLQVEEEEVLSLLERVLQSHLSLPATRGYALTALMKLSTRFSGDINRIRQVVSIYGSCLDVELQQRAVEYNALFRKYDHMRAAILEKMPLVERGGPQADEEDREGQKEEAQAADAAPPPAEPPVRRRGTREVPSMRHTGQVLFPRPDSLPCRQASNLLDLLDLLDGPPGEGPPPPPLAPSSEGTLIHLLDLPCVPPSPPPIPDLRAFERDGLRLDLSFLRPPETPALLLITVTATNTSEGDVTHFICQAAVPKVCRRPVLREVFWALYGGRVRVRGAGLALPNRTPVSELPAAAAGPQWGHRPSSGWPSCNPAPQNPQPRQGPPAAQAAPHLRPPGPVCAGDLRGEQPAPGNLAVTQAPVPRESSRGRLGPALASAGAAGPSPYRPPIDNTQ
ncbi:AP-1 complex subunit gamma-like 2 isoform X2 [Sorex araneus]|uniref:AP-1 complex subunit gamma-like 2 isoform X2 n=1 Tax=Sorex araneus TaxID=42254 RepID=UPI0024334A08|nr:AP-1 complex subunit gamma-like 2 isoform X2 [Sorex araneus]XP_054989953.1 AP-1 complex subunit gamma-like 2 isoform X2 [Sorex araneus]